MYACMYVCLLLCVTLLSDRDADRAAACAVLLQMEGDQWRALSYKKACAQLGAMKKYG
jgi:hypothetical protein